MCVRVLTCGTTGGVQGQDGLDGHIHGRTVEGLEHDLEPRERQQVLLWTPRQPKTKTAAVKLSSDQISENEMQLLISES